MTITLHRHVLSGHCHRVELFLSLLGLPFTIVDVDLASAAHKAPAFLAKNPFGQVPVLDDGEVTIADSAAILVYLANRYGDEGWLPRDPILAAEVQRWLTVAAGPLDAGPARARLAAVFRKPLDVDVARTTAHGLFRVLDAHLADREVFVGARPTIADVALYAYCAHAPEGGVALAAYPHLRAWIARIEALPRFVALRRTETAELASAS